MISQSPRSRYDNMRFLGKYQWLFHHVQATDNYSLLKANGFSKGSELVADLICQFPIESNEKGNVSI